MLNIPAPFPEIGSYGLIGLGGRTHLARIVGRPPVGHGEQLIAMIALPLDPARASGNKRVPLSELLDGTPLSKEDDSRIAALEVEMTGLRKDGKAWRKRRAEADALRLRGIRARQMDDLMKRLPAHLRDAA